MTKRNQPLHIGGVTIQPGERRSIDLEVGRLYTHSPTTMPVQVLCGSKAGPVLFVSAAIHGDELNGVEIIRRLLKVPQLKRLRGTLIAVPIVNLHGFINLSRYFPDRRDLNRSFPGSERGSLAGRVANLFMTEIVSQATHGIDLHTGAINRGNLPQIRANLDDEEALQLAKAFGTPVILNSALRDGSLRMAATDHDIPILLYEAGEALRFDEIAIRGGVEGIVRVMRQLGMLPRTRKKAPPEPVIARSSSWVRAPQSGLFRAYVALGNRVTRNETVLGVVSDPFGEEEIEVHSPWSGIVIGRLNLPLVNEGDAICHIARFYRTDIAHERVGDYTETLEAEDFPYGEQS
ncbi:MULTISPECIES: succinylglutamate desuccinylase/aspartoacylase family protein [unclassified Wenzhouxiangella]|uniref:succinylglutamate desuccinylase/aspartoacylase family protein n=1 Tax=unclassified Wenzhouxiangella TaxID=2613841 RepID=UPI000E3276D6|nr:MULTISPECIES: succinylglutamate desuccinylase/aspartoacylase family protein [unclassified Wenzhouxiangella]RFF27561.1 succinylglutamate desuccinylase [Wenzhouxiangella sp. 15181]RFP69577.1 succinylglutamate desuccinylase [Wenzhouxiangella sp. 15190]